MSIFNLMELFKIKTTYKTRGRAVTLYGIPDAVKELEYDKGGVGFLLIIPFLIGLIIVLVRTIKAKNKTSRVFGIIWIAILCIIIGLLVYYGFAYLGIKDSIELPSE